MSPVTNKKDFTLINRIGKTFSLSISNFQTSSTFLFKIKQKVILTFISHAIQKAIAIINIKKVKILFVSKQIFNMVQGINIKPIRFIYSMKQIMKFVTNIAVVHPILFVSNAIQKVTSTINSGKIHLVFVGTYGQLPILGTFDPQTLLALDTKTLLEMDYTPV